MAATSASAVMRAFSWAVHQFGPGREVGLVDDEPADQDVDVAAAQRPVQIARARGFRRRTAQAG